MHASQFPVRIFDVDVFGELRTAVLLRFLWQTASDASAAVGYDLEWYERAGTLWIIRRTRLERLAPVHYRDALTIRTWVSDIRRVRSQREYTVVRADDGGAVARATTDWVYVDLARGALVQPPPDLQRALMPDGVTSQPRPPSHAGPPPQTAARCVRRVELADLDTVAHVNNAQYSVFVEQMVWDALAARGWRLDPQAGAPRARLTALDLEYFEAARYGDHLAGAVWVTALAADRFETACELAIGGRRALRAHGTWRWEGGSLPAGLGTALRSLAGRT
jgi:acyl-CoA thioesterase FadM